jgi:hypothetical protein
MDAEQETVLAALRDEFPGFSISSETTHSGRRYIARSLRPGTGPHTLVTADLGELRAELRTGEPA